MRYTSHSKNKLSIVAAGIILLAYITFMCAYILFIRHTSEVNTFDYLTEISNQATQAVRMRVEGDMRTQAAIAASIGHGDLPFDPKAEIEYLKQNFNLSSYKRMGIIIPDGTAYTTDDVQFNFSERVFFQLAMNGESNVSDSLIDLNDGEKINVYATPIYRQGQLSAVLFATSRSQVYSQLLDLNSFDGHGFTYITKKDGMPVTKSPQASSLLDEYSSFYLLSKANVTEGSLETVKYNMLNGLSGHLEYTLDGVAKYTVYSPIGINDWYIHSVVPIAATNTTENHLIITALLTTLLTVVLLMGLLAFIVVGQMQSRKSLEQIAYCDNITSHANWNQFARDCPALLHGHPNEKYAAVLFDISKFKGINEIHGYDEGDNVLSFIGRILFDNTKKDETSARISADNFILLMQYKKDSDITDRIQRLIEQFNDYSKKINLNFSFGIYQITNRDISPAVLNTRARLARSTIKGMHNECWAFYNEDLGKQIIREQQLENTMVAALDSGEFQVYLQPKYLFDGEKLVGAEALARWLPATGGMISPVEFIPLFEKNGFVCQLDYYMLEQVCALLKKWQLADKRFAEISISVNLSRVHLSNPNLIEELSHIVSSYDIKPNQIEIEITESTASQNSEMFRRVLHDLKNVGFCLSMDDFGSGYSSLHTLKDLEVDILKLDKGFLSEAAGNTRSQNIIKNLINMSKDLNLKTVAEGVETQEQVTFLKEIGCDIAQGFFYAKPMPPAEFEKIAETDYITSPHSLQSKDTAIII